MSTNSIAAGIIFCEPRQLREHFESRIGHGDDAEIRIDRAERIIRRLRFAGARDRVEERGFPDVRQTDNSSAQHKARRLRREKRARNPAARCDQRS